ncbi:DinB/UmuC family translesion DNA polymerase [Streptomyces sp. NBC_01462]|uniref:DinB/UmuC family translesion DNA polymerase n=1 Tax=Streptomyces sp. NBC_01462 TaxID=2903876 RepID=UPI003FCC3486
MLAGAFDHAGGDRSALREHAPHLPPAHLDGAAVRAALLDLIVTLALQLRRRSQAARGLTLTLRFAGGTTWEKTRRLPEASAHDDDLRTPAYRLIDAAGLQRGRLTGMWCRTCGAGGWIRAAAGPGDRRTSVFRRSSWACQMRPKPPSAPGAAAAAGRAHRAGTPRAG